MKKTIKQIKNLKTYKNSMDDVSIWTARLINGTWQWNWYCLAGVEENPNDFINGINGKFDYRLGYVENE